MRPLLFLPVVVLIVALGTLASAGGKQPYLEDDELTFAFLDLEGRTVRSSDPEFRGKVLLIDLWATWCPPCLEQHAHVTEVAEAYGDRIAVLGVLVDDSPENALRWME